MSHGLEMMVKAGLVASTIKPPTQILLTHFIPASPLKMANSSVFMTKISLCK
jgi:hypothetical protein